MKVRLALSIFFVAALGSLGSPAPAGADPMVDTSIVFVSGDLILTPPCTADTLYFSGGVVLVIHSNVDPWGHVHYSVHDESQAFHGIGIPSGTTYTLSSTSNLEFAVPGPPAEFTGTDDLRVIGTGPDNNFLVHFTIHGTITAGGQWVAAITSSFAECR
ncbi:MAG TPA: hypothetical protein VFJ85_16255 [Acidimicrobiales bacterium]|nr:hypothetical protein [Acidimicrobiales bacterium]